MRRISRLILPGVIAMLLANALYRLLLSSQMVVLGSSVFFEAMAPEGTRAKTSVDFKEQQSLEEPEIIIPQQLRLGRFISQSASPYISHDIWYELVDNRRSFFLRPQEFNESMTDEYWIKWLDSLPWPVKLVMSYNIDYSFPSEHITLSMDVIQHKNVEKVYAQNTEILHPKVMTLPIGLKWQWRRAILYGEEKEETKAALREISQSVEQTKRLFQSQQRTNTVWVRWSMTRRNFFYNRSNPALQTPRSQLCDIVNQTAPLSSQCTSEQLNRTMYYEKLKEHRFVISPAGRGLDCHATYEALLAGCIPIVPKSGLSALFDLLPVWQVESWGEVTDEAITKKSKEFTTASFDKYRLDLIFAEGWAKELKGPK